MVPNRRMGSKELLRRRPHAPVMGYGASRYPKHQSDRRSGVDACGGRNGGPVHSRTGIGVGYANAVS